MQDYHQGSASKYIITVGKVCRWDKD